MLRDPAETDWKSREDLPPANLNAMPPYCPGMYVEPEYPKPRSTDSSAESVRASGAMLSYWIDDRAVLSGDVRLTQGNRSLLTPTATLDIANQHATLDQGVLLREPGFAVRARTAEADLATGASRMNDAAFVLHTYRLRGEAEGVAKDEDGNLTITKGYFTRCEPGNDGWRLSSKEVQIEKDAIFGTARNATLRVKNVPVLYTPFISFPVSDERVSGFLLPNLAYTEQDGADIGLPYYFNLAPNYDATITARYVQERGSGLEGEFRHMGTWAENAIGAAFLYNDQHYDGRFEKDEFEELNRPGDFETENRWLLSLDHDGRVGDLRTFVDYGAVSDVDYFTDLGTELAVRSRVDLERVGSVEWARDGFLARLWGQRFQSLDAVRVEPYQRLPELLLSDQRDLGPFAVSLGGTWSLFDRDKGNFVGIDRMVGSRSHFEPRFSLPLYRPWGFAVMSSAFKYTLYNLDRVPNGFDDTPEREIWMGSADAGLFFDRELSAFGKPLLQTLEPRVYYLFQDRVDQSGLPNFDASPLTFTYDQLFRENRFSGIDRIGDANQTSVGVTSRFVNATTGQEYFRGSIGQIFYFDDRLVTISGPPTEDDRQSRSSIVGELVANVFSRLQIRTNTLWDPHEDEYDELGVAFEYLHDNRHIFNVGYRRLTEGQVIDQSDIALYWPISMHWSFIGRWNYDLDRGRTIESFGGFEYSDCCWQLRALVQQSLQNPGELQEPNLNRETGVIFQIVFRGLAGVGSKVDSVMQNGIKGYYVPEIAQ